MLKLRRLVCRLAAAFGRLCVETRRPKSNWPRRLAAAFGRLCVETNPAKPGDANYGAAAFGRLCVETRFTAGARQNFEQPPSGGCVLKPVLDFNLELTKADAAAFGRLCVETRIHRSPKHGKKAAAFGRLCVETGCLPLSVLT